MSSRLDPIFLAVGRVLQSALLFLTYRELTHLLPKAEVGLYFFLLAITGGIGLILVGPAGTFFNRFLHRWVLDGTLRKNLLTFIVFTGFAAALALGITALVHLFLPDVARDIPFAVAIFVFGSTLNNTFVPALNLLRFPRRFVVLTLSCQALTLGAAVLAARLRPEASMWLGVTGLVNIVFGVIGYFLLRRLAKNEITDAPPQAPEKLASSYWKFVVPLMLANVGIWFLTQGYRPVAQHLFGLEALAVIGLGLGLASSISNAFEQLAHQLYLPRFYEQSHQIETQARRSSWESLWSELVPQYFAVALFITGFSTALVRVLSPTTYADAWIYLSIGAWTEFFRMNSGLVSLLTISELKTKSTIRPFLEGAILCFAIMFFTHWIAVSILIGNVYALLRISLSMKHAATLLSFSSRAGQTVLISLVFLVPLLVREQLEDMRIALGALAIGGPIFAVLMLRNSSWRTRS